MLTKVRYLVDSSAILRLTEPEVAAVIGPLVEAGVVGTCGVVELALLGRLTDAAVRAEVRATRAAAFAWLSTTDDDFRRALEVQGLLAEDGQHGVGQAALVVAAVAERHRVTVLHCNAVFDDIAKVTGQPTEWVMSEGGLSS